MDLSPEQIEAIEEKLRQLTDLDPAQLPGPAAELVELLNDILEESEGS
jgi:hypothetical protein